MNTDSQTPGYQDVEDDLHAAINSLTTLAAFIGREDDVENMGTATIIMDQTERLKRVQSILSDGDAY